jgi:tetratricopeptide (TPR) repeat protein
MLGQNDQAEQTYQKALERYPTTDHVLSGTAAFMWRSNRDEDAAEYIARGRRIKGSFSRWYFDDYMEIFSQLDEERILGSLDALILKGATDWEISGLGSEFHRKKRPDIACMILEKKSPRGAMENLEKIVEISKIMGTWKGDEAAAFDYLQKSVPPKMHGPLTSVLFKQGLFDPILKILREPDAFPQKYREFLWLQKLMAWLALGKTPDSLAREFEAHYDGADSPDYYKAVGRFMLGKISQDTLLKRIRTRKQRCEFAYYIGFSQRVIDNFTEATHWYHLCRETLLSNNGEYHWASNELFWWGHMGTKRRHRLLAEDISLYRRNHEYSR